jgi:hypothetical protein
MAASPSDGGTKASASVVGVGTVDPFSLQDLNQMLCVSGANPEA